MNVPRSVTGKAVAGVKAAKMSSSTQCQVKKDNGSGKSRKYRADNTATLIADGMVWLVVVDMSRPGQDQSNKAITPRYADRWSTDLPTQSSYRCKVQGQTPTNFSPEALLQLTT